MSTNLSPVGGAAAQFLDNNGNPLTGGKLFTYAAGTTTPQATFTTFVGNVAHSNPIILDAAGRVPSGEIWLTATLDYKFTLTTSADVPIATWDNILGINGTGLATNANAVAYDPAGLGAVQRTVESKLRESVSVKDFGAVGDGIANDTDAIQNALDYAATSGVAIYVPAGTYAHTGLTIATGVKLRGAGPESAKLLNISTVNDSVTVPYPGGSVFPNYWEISGLTIDAQTPRSSGQSGIRLDRSSGGVVFNVLVQNHWYNIREKTSWKIFFGQIRSVTGEYGWFIEDDGINPGVPNHRYGVNFVSNEYGLQITGNGVGATVFCGGSIETTTNWALEIKSGGTRALTFVGFNFEANNMPTFGFDIIVGDDAVPTSAPATVTFDGCLFIDRTVSNLKTAFDLNRGSNITVRNCSFIGYLQGADISSNFGTLLVENLQGLTNWSNTATAGVFYPGTSSLILGTRNTSAVVSGGTFRQIHLDSATALLLASRRTTENHDRFEITAAGTIGWHAFNTATADVTFGRLAANCVGVPDDDVIRTGRGATGSRPSASTVGAGSMWYDTTLSKPIWSDGTSWRDAAGTAV
jgi:hypothetical protein